FNTILETTIHERFADMDKDELIKKLVWLQLKDTITNYADAEDLNAGYDTQKKGERDDVPNKAWTRMFLNLGAKDGFNENKLVQFLHEMTEVDTNLIDRVQVRELTSFFNVKSEAKNFIEETLNSRKF